MCTPSDSSSTPASDAASDIPGPANGNERARSEQCEPQPLTARLRGELFKPVDIAPLVFFRIFFGGVMLYHVVSAAKDRWIEFFYVQPDFHLTFPGLAAR